MYRNFNNPLDQASIINDVLRYIADGMSLRQASKEAGSRADVVLRKIMSDTDLADRYVHAFELAVEKYEHRLTELDAMIERGDHPPATIEALQAEYRKTDNLMLARQRSVWSAISTARAHRKAREEKRAEQERLDAERAEQERDQLDLQAALATMPVHNPAADRALYELKDRFMCRLANRLAEQHIEMLQRLK